MAKKHELSVKFPDATAAQNYLRDVLELLKSELPSYNGRGVTRAQVLHLVPGIVVTDDRDEQYGWEDYYDLLGDGPGTDRGEVYSDGTGERFVVRLPNMIEFDN